MIKAIVLDLGGVVFAEGKSVAYERLKADYGYAPKIVNDVLISPEGMDLRKGLMTDEAFWGWASTQLPQNYDVKLIKQYWYEGYIPDDDIFGLINALRGKYQLIVFSGNVKSRIEYLDQRYHFRELFDKEVYSYDYRLMKPDKKFVEAMVTAVGVTPEEIVYVDDQAKDVKEARLMGVNVIVYERGKIQELKSQLLTFGITL